MPKKPKTKANKKKVEYQSDEESEINFSENESSAEIEDYNDDKISDDDIAIEDEDSASEADIDNYNDEDDNNNDGDDCVYKIHKHKAVNDKLVIDEIGDDVEDDDSDIEELNDDNRYVKPEDRITRPYLTEAERVRLLADRAKQLASGSDSVIKGVASMNAKKKAKLELETKKMPLYIERELPGGKIEKWYLWELTNRNTELVDPESKLEVSKQNRLQIETLNKSML